MIFFIAHVVGVISWVLQSNTTRAFNVQRSTRVDKLTIQVRCRVQPQAHSLIPLSTAITHVRAQGRQVGKYSFVPPNRLVLLTSDKGQSPAEAGALARPGSTTLIVCAALALLLLTVQPYYNGILRTARFCFRISIRAFRYQNFRTLPCLSSTMDSLISTFTSPFRKAFTRLLTAAL